MKTSWKKINDDTYAVIINDNMAGRVKSNHNWKWVVDPFFSLIPEDLQDIAMEYGGYVEAGRALASMWANKKDYDLAFVDFQNDWNEYVQSEEDERMFLDFANDFDDP
jgi:hypothetical protein